MPPFLSNVIKLAFSAVFVSLVAIEISFDTKALSLQDICAIEDRLIAVIGHGLGSIEIEGMNAPYDTTEILTLKSDGSELKAATNLRLLESAGMMNIEWSPDGTAVLFSGVNLGNPTSVSASPLESAIYTLNVISGDILRIPIEDSFVYPQWSPDGSTIAFVAQTAEGKYDLFKVNRDGSGMRRITTSGEMPSYLGGWAWSPDGTSIAALASDGSLDGKALVRIDALSGQIAFITTNVQSFVWLPDGKTVAYVSNGTSILNLIDINGANSKELMTEVDEIQAWSPDGTKFVYISSGNLMLADADGTKSRVLAEYKVNEYLRFESWSPDYS
jgi:WD40 repeat protein